jgi:ABC-type multidrug transport system ATPase subunit
MINHASLKSPPVADHASQPSQRAEDADAAPTAPPHGQTGLSVRAVSKRWGERAVLDQADLAIPAGTSVWLGGRNGVGKTTLLRIVAGLIAPDRGEVGLEGLDPHRDRRRYQRKLGFLSAGDRGLYARLTVRQNLQLWARLALLSRRECEAAIEAVAANFVLEELIEARADRLSLGQRQRVRLALAFLHSPHLVLLDEPANSMDDEGLGLIAAAVERLQSRGGMAIWCAPSRPPLDQLAAGYVLREGRLWEDG